MGIHWTGIVLDWLGLSRWLLDHGFPGRAARSHRQGPARGETGADHRGGFQDDGAVIVILPGLLGLALCRKVDGEAAPWQPVAQL